MEIAEHNKLSHAAKEDLIQRVSDVEETMNKEALTYEV